MQVFKMYDKSVVTNTIIKPVPCFDNYIATDTCIFFCIKRYFPFKNGRRQNNGKMVLHLHVFMPDSRSNYIINAIRKKIIFNLKNLVR